MQTVSLFTEVLDRRDRADSWREFICSQIHRVSVDDLSESDFAAEILARSYQNASCASFWSKAHQVRSARESLADSGLAGYLISYQLEGESHITQGPEQFVLRPGEIAIVDGRQEMSVRFPGTVRRMVAKLPAATVERMIPALARRHSCHLVPAATFGSMLLALLTELASQQTDLDDVEASLVAENIGNLLAVCAGRSALADIDARTLQRDLIVKHVRAHAGNPRLTLDAVSAALHLSRRLAQQLLNEAGTTYTDLLNDTRLELARTSLTASPHGAVTDIAYACGFGDISHFNHLFKKKFGASPTQLRLAARQAAADA
jgi:AraC-like DNA-binding protein